VVYAPVTIILGLQFDNNYVSVTAQCMIIRFTQEQAKFCIDAQKHPEVDCQITHLFQIWHLDDHKARVVVLSFIQNYIIETFA